ncbi:MAG: hypothetical protein SLAVMIC_00198 [uncultured marine phage]|uniref:Uncharacterized protein n=1 Tax=uncultured marine phage TaxID=707152 RepID=A0A8D9C8I2_9VIRU|nr:MAG: hypothetical protein SLAVMIC_00198 [uncultured marine phage]
MKPKYRYKLLRWKVRWRRLFKPKQSKIEFDSPQQEKAIRIAERLIRDSDSELLMAPKFAQYEEKLYVRNKNIFIVITRRSVQIINGKYNYDILIFDKLHDYISDKFKRKLEIKRNEMENTITSKVETILDVIYKDIS